MIVTIDGPAGAGKSTVARQLAEALGVAYLDTGAMYRAIALRALRGNVPLDDEGRLARLADEADLQLECGAGGMRVRLDGQDVTDEIRTMAVNEATHSVARVAAVREVLVRWQRAIGRRLGSLVTEGRDQGSVVFPEADVKFLLDADVTTRVQRRHNEMRRDGQDVSAEQIRANLIERDDQDAARWEPMLASGTAVRIDSSKMTIDQVVERMVQEIRSRSREAAQQG